MRAAEDKDMFQCTDRSCAYKAPYKDIKPGLECPECKKKGKKSPMYNIEEERTAAIIENLDRIADEVQVFDERLALEIDKITDRIADLPTTMETKPPNGWVSLNVLMDHHGLSLDNPEYEKVFKELLKSKDAEIFVDPLKGAEKDGNEYFSPKGLKILKLNGLIK